MHIPTTMRDRIPTAITEHLQASVTASNVGREDRLVRGCIALSLLLLGGFTMIGAGQVNLITLAFLILGAYFALTAVLGSDPGYHRAGIDTRTDAELAEREPQEWIGAPESTDAPESFEGQESTEAHEPIWSQHDNLGALDSLADETDPEPELEDSPIPSLRAS